MEYAEGRLGSAYNRVLAPTLICAPRKTLLN